MADWKIETTDLKQRGYSWSEVAAEIQPFFPDLDRQQVLEKVRGHIRRTNKTSKAVGKDKVIGVISDTHFPFCHANYINFLEETFSKYKVTDIVHIGDICDNHAISRFQTDANGHSAGREFELAMKDVEIYTRAFPKVTLIEGNHCTISKRQVATLGIPQFYLKDNKDLWNLPKGWVTTEQIEIDNVMYSHGTGCSGKNGALDRAINNMQSSVIGHQHSFGGVQYKSNSKQLIFGLNAGCGVSINAYAFAYGRYSKNRETLGCGIVLNDAEAYFIPMPNKWFTT